MGRNSAGRRVTTNGGSGSDTTPQSPNGKNKKTSKRKSKSSSYSTKVSPSFSIQINTIANDWKKSPAKTGKKLAIKFILYLTIFLFLCFILEILGLPVLPITKFFKVESTQVEVDNGSNANEDFTNNIDKDEDVANMKNGGLKEGPSTTEEEIPEMQNFQEKKGNKIDKKKERVLACAEVDCNISCNKKINPKCALKKACRADREKICKRRCLKARCEDRCKDEPKFGYVEREQKLDKCKEGCLGSTAQHNKCIKKCHSEFKPCKSRCHEISMKFTCPDKKTENPLFASDDEDSHKHDKKGKANVKAKVVSSGPSDDDEVI